MNPVYNPFSPGAGAPPPELVGRDDVLTDAEILLAGLQLRCSVQSLLLTGLRRGAGRLFFLAVPLFDEYVKREMGR